MNRRRLIVSALAAGPALLVGWGLLPPRSRLGGRDSLPPPPGTADPAGPQVALNGWLRVQPDGAVVLVMPHCEMGQGVHTALPMVVAEELRLPPARVLLEPAGTDSRYANLNGAVESVLWFTPDDTEPGRESTAWRASHHLLGKAARALGLVVTGSSSSVADLFTVLQLAGATARAQLLGAASLQWKLPVAELQLHDGVISHPSGPRAHFGALAAQAAATPPGRVQVTARADWQVLGTAVPRRDTRAKLDGRAVFGTDVQLPGLLVAAIAQGAQRGAGPGAVDVDAVLRRPGVLRVVALPPLGGAAPALAVVARHSWAALKAAQALAGDDGRWQPPPRPWVDSAQVQRQLDNAAEAAAHDGPGFVFRDQGDVDAALARAGTVLQAAYRAPYLAHATMEPPNCTAQVADGRVRLWVPTQVPTLARAAAARVAGVAVDQVELHVPYLGGGFGRRLEVDLVAQAVRVALDTGGAPVRLLWSREQDIGHDFYRPAASALLRATLDERGRPLALAVGSAGDAVMPPYERRVLPDLATGVDRPDKTTAEGLFSLPYRVPHLRVRHQATRSGVPVGSWRSVGHSHNAFFAEGFMDELAHAAGADPLAWRLALLDRLPRHAAVLQLAAQRAGWGGPLPAGRARGLALHESFGTVVAQVAEVGHAAAGSRHRMRVHRVVAAVDCGPVLHPRIAAQQVESGIVFGLGAALFGRIDVVDGAVQQRNFDQYRVLRLAETPAIECHFIETGRAPSGLGEPGTPPVAPAVANAWFALTGERLRELPFKA